MFNIKYIQLYYDLILSNFCCYLVNTKYFRKKYLSNLFLLFFINMNTIMKLYKLKIFLARIVDRIGNGFIKLRNSSVNTGVE